ncbi:MAG: DUF6345 domain-containing protein [Limisphaerales bacterium]
MKTKTTLFAIVPALISRRLILIAVMLSALTLLGWRSAQAQTVYVGNSLGIPNGAADNGAPLVILGEYSKTGPLPTSPVTFPSGTVQDVKFYGQNYNFTLYALTFAGPGPYTNEQTFRIVASQQFSGTNITAVTNTLSISNFSVFPGDLLAFCGQGPYYPQNANDATNSDATYQNPSNPGNSIATPPGAAGSVFTVGLYPDTNATYGYITDAHGNQGRTYGIGVDVLETNLFLPVYQVILAGATLPQAMTLGRYLNIPTNRLALDNGSVGFIDASNHMAVPSIQATNYGKITQLLDIPALTNLPIYSSDLALNSVSNALAAAGLTPQLATPSVHHVVFNCFVTNGDTTTTSVHQYLNTMVHYSFSMPSGPNLFPLIGAGAKTVVDFGPTGNVTHLYYAARQLTPGPLVKIITPTEASNRVAGRLGPNAGLSMALAYAATAFDPPPYAPKTVTWNPSSIIPMYVFKALITHTNAVTGGNDTLIATETISATDDTNYVPSIIFSASALGGTQVVASVSVTGGTPPYFYLWSGSDSNVSTNTGASVSYTARIRVVPPSLTITRLSFSNLVTLSWPYPSAGFVLQSTTNLVSRRWGLVVNPVQTNTGMNVVTLTASGELFVRLTLVTNVLPANEGVSVTVTDANGVSVQTNQTLAVLAEPADVRSGSLGVTPQLVAGTYGEESPYDVDNFDTQKQSWRSTMQSKGGGTETFNWTQYNSWPGDFVEPNPAGGAQVIPPNGGTVGIFADADSSGVNTANMVVYFGHGGASPPMFTFTTENYPLDGSCAYWLKLPNDIVNVVDYWENYGGLNLDYSLNLLHSWGNYGPNDSLNWIGFFACNMLQWNINDPNDNSAQKPGSVYAPQVWINAFNGLHLMLGYHSEYYRGCCGEDNTPGDFANLMLGNNGYGAQTILNAWFLATERDQPEGFNLFYCNIGCTAYVWPAAMGPLGPLVEGVGLFGTAYYNQWIGEVEYYPTSVNQGLSPSQIEGWWYINEQ